MAKTIEGTEKDREARRSLTEIMGLIDLDVVRHESDEKEKVINLMCVPRREAGVCPDCSRVTTEIHDYPHQRQIHDTPARGFQMYLIFDVHRLKCGHCGTVFTMPIRDVVSDCTYTYRLAEWIGDPKRKQDVQTLAQTSGLGYKLVESILFKAAEEKLTRRADDPIVVKKLGIDEISKHKGQGNYVLVLTDLEKRIVLDILPDRLKDTLKTWLKHPSAGIDLSALDTAAIDLWSHYRDAVIEVFGEKVSVVADRFHVVQNLNTAIHDARRKAQSQAKTEGEKNN
ncbi:MAG: transposase [Deltaproteobacteria bacterium]|jgi:transposase|nr:transposase [Deltaproteobacteria bacterium]